MRLDPPGFTGPPTSNDHDHGNDEPPSFVPIELPPANNHREPGSPLGRWDRRCPRDPFPAATVCYWFESVQDGPEHGNATAFHVSYDSVSRSEVRARAHVDTSVSERPRCNDRDLGFGGRSRDDHEDRRRDVFRSSSTSRRSSRVGSEIAKWRRRARGHAESPEFPIAHTRNHPPADVHTAQNNLEDGRGRDGDVSRAASTGTTDDLRTKPETPRDVLEEEDEVESMDGVSRDESARGRRRSDYTARFEEPTTNGSRCHDSLAINGPTKASRPRSTKYWLLFILYLLAWPLVCSTNPSSSGQFAPDFAQSPSLGFTENLPQHNVSQISSLLSASLTKQQHHHQQQQQQQQQQQHHRQTEKQHRAREQYVQDAEYGGNGHRRGGHDEEEQQREQQQQEQREEREAEESSYPEADTVHPYNEYNWEVNQINPWLSACDLAGPAPADLQGSCGPPEVPKNCPTACATNLRGDQFLEVIKKVGGAVPDAGRREPTVVDGGDGGERSEGVAMAPEQCLFYLEESHKRDICRDDFGLTSTRSFLTLRKNRYWFMSGLRLRHCCEHAVVNALAPGKGGPLENVLNGGQKCTDALDKLLLVDALAARLHCEFEEVLARYDCGQSYSVIFNCTHCKEAYRKWVCSSLVPYFAHGEPQDLDSLANSGTGSRLRPCRSFCQSVEQRCPYLLPGDRAPAYPTQYAGEPTFLCRDPNIPETGEQAARALHSSEEDECCFHACSEERPEAGICANCTDQEPRKRKRSHDPPTAPHCEINPIQPASTGVQYPPSMSTDSSTEVDQTEESSTSSPNLVQPQQGASLCGSGGVGSIPSVSSSDRSSLSIVPQLVWLCSLLGSLFGSVRSIPVRWIPRAFARVGKVLAEGASGVAGSSAAVWLRGCCGRGDGSGDSSMRRHDAISPVERRGMVERRCRGWWCWCWWWWWWRWRRTSTVGRVRWKLRAGGSPGRGRGVRGGESGCSGVVREPFRGWPSRVRRWTRYVGEFAVKWRWWWWWLYRWWRSRRTRRRGPAGLVEGRTGPRAFRGANRRGGKRRARSDGLGDDAPPGRRYLRLSSRKDPP